MINQTEKKKQYLFDVLVYGMFRIAFTELGGKALTHYVRRRGAGTTYETREKRKIFKKGSKMDKAFQLLHSQIEPYLNHVRI
jgi:hypothetical protein